MFIVSVKSGTDKSMGSFCNLKSRPYFEIPTGIYNVTIKIYGVYIYFLAFYITILQLEVKIAIKITRQRVISYLNIYV